MKNIKFIVDSMLGKLARWLRILGYDTYYNPIISDEDILAKALSERRILVTRDRELAIRAEKIGIECFLAGTTNISDILSKLNRRYSIRLEIDFNSTRCPKCNAELALANKSEISRYCPEYILKKYDIFLICRKCNSIYWPGRHFKNILKTLEEARRKSILS